MTNKITAYPLCWPEGWKRTPVGGRKAAKFSTKRDMGGWSRSVDLSIDAARQRTFSVLEMMRVDDVVLSANIPLRLDGFPRSNCPEPVDPGVAAYWIDPNFGHRCMAIDRYDRVADNIAAIAATLDAMRAIERHGGAEILNRAFTGFVALPAPEQWWHVLGFEDQDVSEEEIVQAHRSLAQQHHPDRGGDNEQMARINWARSGTRTGFSSINQRRVK